jgi:hypothetical protein
LPVKIYSENNRKSSALIDSISHTLPLIVVKIQLQERKTVRERATATSSFTAGF